MIGQYLLNTNKIGTIHILPKILELNKALDMSNGYQLICLGRYLARQPLTHHTRWTDGLPGHPLQLRNRTKSPQP